ncbi:MAG: ADP-ribosylglycohydrolase family protein [Anaerolineaceae bacterium]|nr:ADP-ribosylglycohydrolase family protein [Anaerolineaceae bacterium]
MQNTDNSLLFMKTLGCLYGGAVGDALGAPAEWRLPDEIRSRYGYITDFVENWDGPSDIGKGDGRYTDDTHMTQLLSRAYIEHGDHLDAYAFARRIVPMIAEETRWVPEYGREMLLIERLFYPEKWLYMRLSLANAEPRQGGIGNMVNCGAAMYAAPVGVINAADPIQAYHEAISIFSAHQQSYGLEAAGVMAACVAEAFNPGASVDSIVEVALTLAKDGTRRAIAAVVDCARQYDDWKSALAPLREAVRPFDGAAETKTMRGNGTNNWQPSREHSIEELPIALGLLVVTGGDFEQSVLGGANYGRDNDSIAGMTGAISGAMHGVQTIRTAWIDRINQANRVNLTPLAHDLAALAQTLQQRQMMAAQARDKVLAILLQAQQRA